MSPPWCKRAKFWKVINAQTSSQIAYHQSWVVFSEKTHLGVSKPSKTSFLTYFLTFPIQNISKIYPNLRKWLQWPSPFPRPDFWNLTLFFHKVEHIKKLGGYLDIFYSWQPMVCWGFDRYGLSILSLYLTEILSKSEELARLRSREPSYQKKRRYKWTRNILFHWWNG